MSMYTPEKYLQFAAASACDAENQDMPNEERLIQANLAVAYASIAATLLKLEDEDDITPTEFNFLAAEMGKEA